MMSLFVCLLGRCGYVWLSNERLILKKTGTFAWYPKCSSWEIRKKNKARQAATNV